MRKILTSFALVAASLAFAQVGVNNDDPKATLHIEAKEKTGATTGVDGILIPRVDRLRAQSMSGVEESTLIYVENVSTGAQAGKAQDIDAKGFYYYVGDNLTGKWVKLGDGATAPTTGTAQTWREIRTKANTNAVTNPSTPYINSNGGIYQVTVDDELVPETAFFVIVGLSGNTSVRLPKAKAEDAGRMIVISKTNTGSTAVLDYQGKQGGITDSELKGDGGIFRHRGKIFITDGIGWYPVAY